MTADGPPVGNVAACREKLLSFASPLQLYAEEIDPHTGRHLGNARQALTHLALINAVMHVIRAEKAATGAAGGTRVGGLSLGANASWPADS